jgi:hypothetical protein
MMCLINILYKENPLWLSRASSIVAEITGGKDEYVKYLRFETLKSLITHSDLILSEDISNRHSMTVNELYLRSIGFQDLGVLCILRYDYIKYWMDDELWIKNTFRQNKPAIVEMVIRDPRINDRAIGYDICIRSSEERGNTTMATLLRDLQKSYPEERIE